MHQGVYVNRTLNLKRIRYLGLDMDHTLIRYDSEAFEKLSHSMMKEKLVRLKKYPETVLGLPFNFSLATRGLVIDRKKGNVLKLNRHSAIRASYHGLTAIDFKTQRSEYRSIYIDLSDSDYLAVDTMFSISLASLFMQVVDLKDKSPQSFPDYAQIADDVLQALDLSHRDGSVKSQVRKELSRFIIKDPKVVSGLETFRKHGKKLFIVTNSDYDYTRLLLDYAINPFLQSCSHWSDLFDFVITSAQKPRFFYDQLKFLKVNPVDGTMTNYDAKLVPGIYQGGGASQFTTDLELEADEILYIGDHIYGDILRLKKDCGWRTAMVIEELEREVNANKSARPIVDEIDSLMKKKEPLEDELTEIRTNRVNSPGEQDQRGDIIQRSIVDVDSQISNLIRRQQSMYNSYWGQMMRSGNEESYFAYQVDRYACVYMARLSDLLDLSPRTYFRAPRRPLSHEIG